MDDDQPSLLSRPDPEPPANTAAEAFARLAERVAGMEERLEGRMAVMARALEHIALEKQSIEIPDYNPTLGKMNGHLADMGKHIKAIENAPALQVTPESMAERIVAAAQDARETDKASIKEVRELQRHAVAAMIRTTGTLRAKEDQRRQIFYAIGGALLAASLLWALYPGWAASMAPQGWLWPEQVARRTLGELTLWDAGIRLMSAGNPDAWAELVRAADIRRENGVAIAGCERAAAKTRMAVPCTIRVREPSS